MLARRIGRNELAVIDTCRAYIAVQRAFEKNGHDGKPAGLYARKFGSDPGTQNGLHWPAKRGEPRSPMGDLVAAAAEDGYDPPRARTGAVSWLLLPHPDRARAGSVRRRHGLRQERRHVRRVCADRVARAYDATGIMTFVVSGEGMVFDKDLGPETAASAKAVTRYDPDSTWRNVQADAGGKP